jgi:hypothetical protein
LAAQFAGCGSGASDTGIEAHVKLTLRGFAAQPAAIAAASGSSARYSAARIHVVVAPAAGGAKIVDENFDGAAVVIASGGVAGVLDVSARLGAGSYVASGEVFNAQGERLYTFGPATFDGASGAPSVDAGLTYVGPGNDVVAVNLAAPTALIEVYQSVSFGCSGERGDGTSTTEFPRFMSSDNEDVATVNTSTYLVSGQRLGIANIECRLGFGTFATSRLALQVTNRTPTTPVSLILEAPPPLAVGETFVVPIGTRIPVKVRALDIQGGYAAGATLVFTMIIGSASAVDQSQVVTGNDGTASVIFTPGAGTCSLRITILGSTTPSASVTRYGN